MSLRSLTTNQGISRHSKRDVAQTAHVGRSRQLNKTAQRQYRQSRVTGCRRQTKWDSSPLGLLAGTLGVASQSLCRLPTQRCLRQSKQGVWGRRPGWGEGGWTPVPIPAHRAMKPSYFCITVKNGHLPLRDRPTPLIPSPPPLRTPPFPRLWAPSHTLTPVYYCFVLFIITDWHWCFPHDHIYVCVCMCVCVCVCVCIF